MWTFENLWTHFKVLLHKLSNRFMILAFLDFPHGTKNHEMRGSPVYQLYFYVYFLDQQDWTHLPNDLWRPMGAHHKTSWNDLRSTPFVQVFGWITVATRAEQIHKNWQRFSLKMKLLTILSFFWIAFWSQLEINHVIYQSTAEN